MKKDILRLTIKAGIIFTFVTTCFAVTYYRNADLARELLQEYMTVLESVMEDDGSLSWFALYKNNLFSCALTVGMGLMPVIFLPIWVLVSNAIIMGAVFGFGAAEAGMSLLESLVFGILPHGIFELPGLFLSIGLGYYLCNFMTKKLFRKAPDQSLLDVLNAVAKAFVLIVIPLITIASLIECFVTPEIMAWAGL